MDYGNLIFVHNRSILNVSQSKQLKSPNESVMLSADNYKLIVFPWESIDVPVVMTSWGKLHHFSEFDVDAALTFIVQNREKSPEPSGH